MIDWQMVSIALLGCMSSWAAWEVRSLRRSIHELRNMLQPVIADVAYLKGFQAAQLKRAGRE
jgi:hypothetical protein